MAANAVEGDTTETRYLAGSEKMSDTRDIILRTTRVVWGIPQDEIMFSRFFKYFWQCSPMPWDAYAATESTYLPKARNEIHNGFLDMTNYNYLVMLDSDVIPPPDFLLRLLAHDLPIVGGWYRNKKITRDHPTPHPIVYDWGKVGDDGNYYFKRRENPGEGLERVEGIGAGCLLMRRDVAEALGRDPYDMNKAAEDLKMCKKLMDLDIPLHVDWSVNCAHLGVTYV